MNRRVLGLFVTLFIIIIITGCALSPKSRADFFNDVVTVKLVEKDLRQNIIEVNKEYKIIDRYGSPYFYVFLSPNKVYYLSIKTGNISTGYGTPVLISLYSDLYFYNNALGRDDLKKNEQNSIQLVSNSVKKIKLFETDESSFYGGFTFRFYHSITADSDIVIKLIEE